jgi:murein L,D-transpeptidase YafK
MRARRIAVGLAALAAVALLSLVAWDFMQLARAPPALAAPAARADKVLVEKSARRLTLLRDGTPLKSYEVALGSETIGHKQQEGDGRTPEGLYAVDFKHPRSRFHLALRISYPNSADRSSAAQHGVAPGGDIMIHGLPNGLGWLGGFHLKRDWTDGCIAVTDNQIDEIWAMVDVGTEVEIKP